MTEVGALALQTMALMSAALLDGVDAYTAQFAQLQNSAVVAS